MSITVLVEKNAAGQTIRIFRSDRVAFSAALNPDRTIAEVDADQAVKDIRHQLWLRSKGFCELCASVVTESSGHMHEMKHRGKGGEISLANSVFVCPRTHRQEHKDRSPRWSKKT